MEQKIQILKMNSHDVEKMTVVMKRAFDEDARRHLGRETGGPPGYDNGTFLQRYYLKSGADAYKIILDGDIIGGFNIFQKKGRQRFLGNIFIDPLYQDQGYGTFVWNMIEKMYPDTLMWATETPGFSKRNHHFYVNKCGFHIVRIDHPKQLEEENYILIKNMKE